MNQINNNVIMMMLFYSSHLRCWRWIITFCNTS